MTVTIAVMNTKGGVGKTTTAMLLANALAERGRTVEVRDLDPSSSALIWAEQVEETGLALPFSVVPAHASVLHRRTSAQVVIVDTAPSNKGDIAAAAELADFVVVPTKPGQAELVRTLETIKYLDPKKTAVLLTQVERTTATKTLRESLEGAVNLFETEIPKREAVRRVYGTRPETSFGYNDVVDELIEEIPAV